MDGVFSVCVFGRDAIVLEFYWGWVAGRVGSSDSAVKYFLQDLQD